ncbi:hypothetical protein D4Z93_00250 [Clostridium fermenticellae]|uniref:Uncharacterized protein n=1 Tax=Clostridium fermenticellae TaxID=2068654 RepID=A0A386H090_9CLOT|nr:hypothetical protein [Clostridium fermenticellae]AYD39082.1 hypothetical protein D4Z93_00250 [Clostridium fermenticellae]
MLSFQDKMLVAQNCSEYEGYNIFSNISSISPNCDYCVNFKNGMCSKKLFNEIDGIIKLN